MTQITTLIFDLGDSNTLINFDSVLHRFAIKMTTNSPVTRSHGKASQRACKKVASRKQLLKKPTQKTPKKATTTKAGAKSPHRSPPSEEQTIEEWKKAASVLSSESTDTDNPDSEEKHIAKEVPSSMSPKKQKLKSGSFIQRKSPQKMEIPSPSPSPKASLSTKNKAKRIVVKKETVDGSEFNTKRGIGFRAFEDIALCKAYVNATENLVSGCDMKAATFWNLVLEKYNCLVADDNLDEDIILLERDTKSIRRRFQRYIQKGVMEWNPYFRRIKEKSPSGVLEMEYIQKASEEFMNMTGKPFPYEHCVEILHVLPKFDPFVMEDDKWSLGSDNEDIDSTAFDDGKKPTANQTTAAMGSRLQRPMGTKAAKKLAAQEKTKHEQNETHVRALQSLAAANEAIAASINRKSDISRLTNLVQIWTNIGNMEKATEYAVQLENLMLPSDASSEIPMVSSGTIPKSMGTVPESVTLNQNVPSNSSDNISGFGNNTVGDFSNTILGDSDIPDKTAII